MGSRSWLIFAAAGIFLSLFSASSPAKSKPAEATPADTTLAADEPPPAKSLGSFFKDKELDIFPVPIFETRPDEGQSYGLMPVLLLSDKDSRAISTILAAMGQWNEVVKFSGALIFHQFFDPVNNPDQVLQVYFEWGQKFYREAYVRYFNPRLEEKFYLDGSFLWLKTPFRRFFGYGAATALAGESNYLSNNLIFNGTFGYYILQNLRVGFTENIVSTDIHGRAITDFSDTLATYGALPGVEDATNLIHRFSVTFDNRPSGLNSKRGTFAEAAYFFSSDKLLSDDTINGYSIEAVQLFSYFKERMTTATRFYLQDMYGTSIPFYLQSSLGGDKELRSFIPNRFIDTGKILFSVEQRIRLIRKTVFGIPCELWTDPFLEIGRVFNHINHLGGDDYQTVAGLGLRFIVPPNVAARVDIAIGSDGYNVYTQLGYPF